MKSSDEFTRPASPSSAFGDHEPLAQDAPYPERPTAFLAETEEEA